MLTIRRLAAWSPPSTPPPGVRPATQVSTNGRGAVVYLLPADSVPSARPYVTPGGTVALTPQPPKLMMDPTDRSTWQRPYRFT
jgi:hypothetical protein